MIRAAILFFALALVALVLGAQNFAGVSMEIGKILVIAFLVLAVITGVIGLVTGRTPKNLP